MAATTQAQNPKAQTWDRLVDRYFDEAVFRYNPSAATSNGFHNFDTALEDYSQNAVRQQIALLGQFEREINAFQGAPADDRALLLTNIHATLLSLQSIRMWREESGSVFQHRQQRGVRHYEPEVRCARRSAHLPDRAREADAEAFRRRARQSEEPLRRSTPKWRWSNCRILSAFSKKTCRWHLKMLPIVRCSMNSIRPMPRWFANSTAYRAWLKNDLLPRSNGDFRLGADNYRKKLLYDEMVDIPLDKLLEIGFADLRRNQQSFRDTAKKIDATKTPQQILEQAEKNHPAPDKLLQAFRDTLEGLRTYIAQHKIATIPIARASHRGRDATLRARTYLRVARHAGGLMRKVAKEAFFNVTLPEKKLDSERPLRSTWRRLTAESLSARRCMRLIPAIICRAMWLDRAPSKTRKLTAANTYVEGWATTIASR